MPMFSTLPGTYDAAFIFNKAGVVNHAGWDRLPDGQIKIGYMVSDADAVSAAIDAFPVEYANVVLKPTLWERVKKFRAARESLPAPTPVGPVDTDDSSKIKVLGIVMMAQLAIAEEQNLAAAEGRLFNPAKIDFEEEFTMADNTTTMLNAFEAIAMGKAVGKYISDCHAHGRELRTLINAAEDMDALALIDVESNWPPSGNDPVN